MEVNISESDIFSINQMEKVHSFRVHFCTLLADGRLPNCGLSHKVNRNVLGMFCSCCLLTRTSLTSLARYLGKLLNVVKCFYRLKYSKILKVHSHTNDQCLQSENKSNLPVPPEKNKGKQKTLINGNNKTARKNIRASTVTLNGPSGISLGQKFNRMQ